MHMNCQDERVSGSSHIDMQCALQDQIIRLRYPSLSD